MKKELFNEICEKIINSADGYSLKADPLFIEYGYVDAPVDIDCAKHYDVSTEMSDDEEYMQPDYMHNVVVKPSLSVLYEKLHTWKDDSYEFENPSEQSSFEGDLNDKRDVIYCNIVSSGGVIIRATYHIKDGTNVLSFDIMIKPKTI